MPDWKSPADYAFTFNLDDSGWTWEFLRRNTEYRADYATVAKLQALNQMKVLGSESKVSSDSESLPVGWWALGAKWWINGPICNPVRNEPPNFIRGFPWQPNFKQVENFFRADPDEAAWEHIVTPHEIPKIQRSVFATLVFDLRKSVSPQTERARKLLLDQQATLKKEVKKPSPHKGSDKWQLYIRLLDAREAKAPYAEIAQVIFKDQLGGKKGYDPTKKIEKQLMRARELQEDALSLLGWTHPIQSG
jgi:Family of unknown function (DUF6499)